MFLRTHLMPGLWRERTLEREMSLDHKRDRHLMYPIVCNCVHSSDEEG